MKRRRESMDGDVFQALQSLAEWSASGSEAAPRPAALAVLTALETLAGRGPWAGEDRASVHRLLDETGRSPFLRSLGEASIRRRWAEAAFRLVRGSDFSLLELFQARVRTHPRKVLFEDRSGPIPVPWTYEQVGQAAREIAAAFFSLAEADGRPPRVALFAENSYAGACADLACLFHDILDSPLNTHFGRRRTGRHLRPGRRHHRGDRHGRPAASSRERPGAGRPRRLPSSSSTRPRRAKRKKPVSWRASAGPWGPPTSTGCWRPAAGWP